MGKNNDLQILVDTFAQRLCSLGLLRFNLQLGRLLHRAWTQRGGRRKACVLETPPPPHGRAQVEHHPLV